MESTQQSPLEKAVREEISPTVGTVRTRLEAALAEARDRVRGLMGLPASKPSPASAPGADAAPAGAEARLLTAKRG